MSWYLHKALLIRNIDFERKKKACLSVFQSIHLHIATNADEWLGLNTPRPRGKVAELQVRW